MDKRFVKLAKEFGIIMDGNREIKKNCVYGRDDKSLFYCERFPKNYQGNNPKLKIYRFLYKKAEGLKKSGAIWTLVEECSDTTRNIWKVYCKNGRQEVLNRLDMDFKRNKDVSCVSKYMNQNPFGSTKNKYTSVAQDYYVRNWFKRD